MAILNNQRVIFDADPDYVAAMHANLQVQLPGLVCMLDHAKCVGGANFEQLRNMRSDASLHFRVYVFLSLLSQNWLKEKLTGILIFECKHQVFLIESLEVLSNN